MKKLLFAIMLVPIVFTSHAKSFVGTYTLSFFNKSFNVEAGVINKGKFPIYIDVVGETSEKAYISVDSKDLEKFKQSLLSMKDKYIEWSKIATDNNVSEMSKFMDIKFPPVAIFWETSKIHFSVNNKLNPVFSVSESGHSAIIAVPTKSATNRYITENIYWAFSTPEEIDELISLLDIEKITSIISETKNLTDLFN